MNTDKVFDELKQWDISEVKKYLLAKGVYTAGEIDDIELEYKRFLALAITNRGTPVPISEKVDPMWHTHIMFTHNYMDMSMKVNGAYIHHIPAADDDLEMLTEPFEKNTLSLYRAAFGEPDPKYWNARCCKKCTCHVPAP